MSRAAQNKNLINGSPGAHAVEDQQGSEDSPKSLMWNIKCDLPTHTE